jgi:hypothetical protein
MIKRFVSVAVATALVLCATSSADAITTHHTSREDQLATLREANRHYQDLQRAEDSGYELFTDAAGIACIAMPGMGGMGVHFVKSALAGDAAESVSRPEALVYRIDSTGKLRLAAAEYIVLAAAWDATHSAPPRLFGHVFTLIPAGNQFGLPAYYSLHAWAWYHNPAGTFAPYNPRVHC